MGAMSNLRVALGLLQAGEDNPAQQGGTCAHMSAGAAAGAAAAGGSRQQGLCAQAEAGAAADVPAAFQRAASGRPVQCLRAPHGVLNQGPDWDTQPDSCLLACECRMEYGSQTSVHMQLSRLKQPPKRLGVPDWEVPIKGPDEDLQPDSWLLALA